MTAKLAAGHQEAKDAFQFGAQVRTELQRRGLTPSELAEMGTTQPTIARLVAGGVTPTLDTRHRAADALGIELVVDSRQDASALEEVSNQDREKS